MYFPFSFPRLLSSEVVLAPMQLSRWEKLVVTSQGRFAKGGRGGGRCRALPGNTSWRLKPAALSKEESVPEWGGMTHVGDGRECCCVSVNWVPQTMRRGGKTES